MFALAVLAPGAELQARTLVGPPSADSQPAAVPSSPGSVRPAEGGRLVMALVGDTGFVERDVEAALAGHLADLAIDVDVVQIEQRRPAELLAWARARSRLDPRSIVMWYQPHTSDGRRVGRLHLRWSDKTRGPRVYVRELGTGLSVEVMAVTVRTLTQAITTGQLEGSAVESGGSAQSPGMRAPSSGAAPLDDRGAAVPSKPRRALDLELFYSGGSLADSPAWQHGLGGGLMLVIDPRFSLGLNIAGLWAPGADSPVSGVVTAIRRVPLSLGGRYRWSLGRLGSRRLSRPLEVAAGVRGTLEWFSWELDETKVEVLRGSPGSRWRMAVGADAEIKWRFWGPLGLVTRIGGDLWLYNSSVSVQVRKGVGTSASGGDSDELTGTPLVSPHWLSVTVFAGIFVRL